MNKYSAIYHSEIGWLQLVANEVALVACDFIESPSSTTIHHHPILDIALLQLHEYFQKQRHTFSLPLQPSGRTFSQQVWQQLQQIPFATTRSYREIATALGNPKAGRAVGQANRCNPLVIFIPCHRVIASHGKLGGYSSGLWRKEWLLAHEQQAK